MADEWRRMTTPESARTTLDELWAAVARGGLHAPADRELEAELLFGTEQRWLSTDPQPLPNFRTGPAWPRPGLWITPRDPWGAFTGEERQLPATLWSLPRDAGELAREYGPASTVPPVTPPEWWTAQVVGNAARSDERGRLGVQTADYPSTPRGTHSVALTVAAAEAIAEVIDTYVTEEPIPPAREGTAFRREAAALRAFAEATRPAIDATSRAWLPLANAWISPTRPAPAGGRPNVVPATLRANGRNHT